MIPFFMVFEKRKPQARELIIIATLSAIAVAGRAAFFMLPNFKPVCAIVIIAGVCFGAESGFLVGAVSGFVQISFSARVRIRPGRCSALASSALLREFSLKRAC